MPITSFFAVMFGIVGLIFGLLGLSRVRQGIATNKGVAMSGLIISALVIVLGIWGMSLFFSTVDKLTKDMQDLGAGLPSPTAAAAPTASSSAQERARSGTPSWQYLLRLEGESFQDYVDRAFKDEKATLDHAAAAQTGQGALGHWQQPENWIAPSPGFMGITSGPCAVSAHTPDCTACLFECLWTTTGKG
jgi:uncharacterized iron-regulated membrane protein